MLGQGHFVILGSNNISFNNILFGIEGSNCSNFKPTYNVTCLLSSNTETEMSLTFKFKAIPEFSLYRT